MFGSLCLSTSAGFAQITNATTVPDSTISTSGVEHTGAENFKVTSTSNLQIMVYDGSSPSITWNHNGSQQTKQFVASSLGYTVNDPDVSITETAEFGTIAVFTYEVYDSQVLAGVYFETQQYDLGSNSLTLRSHGFVDHYQIGEYPNVDCAEDGQCVFVWQEENQVKARALNVHNELTLVANEVNVTALSSTQCSQSDYSDFGYQPDVAVRHSNGYEGVYVCYVTTVPEETQVEPVIEVVNLRYDSLYGNGYSYHTCGIYKPLYSNEYFTNVAKPRIASINVQQQTATTAPLFALTYEAHSSGGSFIMTNCQNSYPLGGTSTAQNTDSMFYRYSNTEPSIAFNAIGGTGIRFNVAFTFEDNSGVYSTDKDILVRYFDVTNSVQGGLAYKRLNLVVSENQTASSMAGRYSFFASGATESNILYHFYNSFHPNTKYKEKGNNSLQLRPSEITELSTKALDVNCIGSFIEFSGALEGLRWQLLDVTGKKLLESTNSSYVVSGIKNGYYLIKATNGQDFLDKKILIVDKYISASLSN